MTEHDTDPADLWEAAKGGHIEHVKRLLYQYPIHSLCLGNFDI